MNDDDRNTAPLAGRCTCVEPAGPCTCIESGRGCDCTPCGGALTSRCAADCNCEMCQCEDTLS